MREEARECVRECVCARARACVCVCARARVCWGGGACAEGGGEVGELRLPQTFDFKQRGTGGGGGGGVMRCMGRRKLLIV